MILVTFMSYLPFIIGIIWVAGMIATMLLLESYKGNEP